MTRGPLTPPPLDIVPTLSSGRILVVILAGLLFGMAFQLLLANLGIAIGLSVFDLKPSPKHPTLPDQSSGSDLDVIAIIGIAAGLAIMLSIDGVLFSACFLAVTLSQVSDPWLGGVLGLLIWSVYLILLTWLSTSAVGTVADTLLGFTSTGLRRLFTAVRQLFISEADSTTNGAEDEEVVETVKQQVLDAVEEIDLGAVFEDTVAQLKSKNASWQVQLSNALEEIEETLEKRQEIDPDQIVELLQERANVPQTGLDQIRNQLSDLWQDLQERTLQPDVVADLKHFLQTADPSDLQTDTLESKLVQLETPPASQLMTGLQNIDIKKLLRTALRRVDLSDWDVQRIWQLLQSTQQQFTDTPSTQRPVNIIQMDIEDYLLNTPAWDLQPEVIDVDFKEVIFDPEAAPELVHQQLRFLSADQFLSILKQREDLPTDRQIEVAQSLETVLQSIQDQVQPSQQPESIQPETLNHIQQKLESYLRYTALSKLSPEGVEQKLQALIEDTHLQLAALRQHSPELDADALQDILSRRQGLKSQQRQQLLTSIHEAWQHLLLDPDSPETTAPPVQQRVKAMIVESLKDIDGETVTLEDLKPHLVQLIDQPTSGLSSFNQYLGQLDWIALAQDLQQEHSLNLSSVNAALSWLQDEWQQVAQVPRRWARRTQRSSKDWQKQLQNYLKYQDRSALTKVESMEQDLQHLLDEVKDWPSAPTLEPKSSQSWSWPQQLALPDQAAIVAILQERRDLTTAEIEQIASHLTSAWRKFADEAQHLQHQAQASVDDAMAKSRSQTITQVRKVFDAVSIPAPDPSQLQTDLGQFLSLPATELKQLGDNLRSLAKKAPTAILEDTSVQRVRDRISHLTQSTLDNMTDTLSDLEESVSQQLIDQAEALQHQLFAQIDQVQAEVKHQATEFKEQTQVQADKVRQSAAIAAWWLFGITFTSGLTAAVSGFLAIRGIR